MTRRLDHTQLLTDAKIVTPPVAQPRACDEHGFELPGVLYGALAALLFGFLIVLTIGFAAPGLAVPMGVNFFFLAAFFAVPAIFVHVAPEQARSRRWAEFLRNGVQTATGHSSAGEAAVLMLTLPALIFAWSIAVVTIAALV